ncbi:MAG: Ig-like domain-containing protein, partial [Bacteroidales bacterium]
MKYILNFKVSIAIFLFITIQILISCAKIGSPSGGNYDRTPPKLLEANPKHNSTNYKGNEFEIMFDEYIVLANTSEDIIISPPLKNKPTIKSNLKTLSVSWTDTLSDNTTYIFDFGSSIVDYTEGNKLDKFSYSFSTGPYIDTNEYKGKLIEAYSQKPVSNKYVMLYKSEDSSIVSKQKPNYVTRTDSNGNYHFRNIAKEKYLILALDDKNQNLLYDLSTEPIAFSNEMIEATIYSKDSIKNLQSNKTNIL